MTNPEELIKHVRENAQFLDHNLEIFEILEGDLLDKIKANMRRMLISDRAYDVASKLIPPINLLRQVNNKLSTIYANPPERTAENVNDQILIEYYEENANVNTSFHEANRFFNSQKVAAVEPFVNERNEPMIRAISGHQFLVHSSSVTNPRQETEFIKYVGEMDGKKVFFIYSDEQFAAVNSDGDRVPEFDQTGGVNPYGVIPQTYIKRTRNLLIPLIDSDTVQMSLLLPSMWASMNYGISYQAHSLIYGIDLDFENIEMNPDSFMVFKSDVGGDKNPQIGSIKPQIDIEATDKHILDLFNAWLESMNIRPGEATGNSANSLSGVALAIKEMDTTINRKNQIAYFKEAEKDFWQKLKKVHNYWVDSGKIQNFPKFSEDFDPVISFGEIQVTEDQDKIIDRQDKLMKGRLTTRRKALEKIHPDLDEAAIDEMLEEIEANNVIEVVDDAEEFGREES